ncbi:hypothetical protein JZ751_028414 [Albula glossodonta]|uniref:Protein kinase domain-containing protein n=1 Tax=Albula glossodonta TaxID=121402 RepID=A0A8T2NCD2_9TELE|nr:hypothetical protein JZ751_028414 [Albula glossodonta]
MIKANGSRPEDESEDPSSGRPQWCLLTPTQTDISRQAILNCHLTLRPSREYCHRGYGYTHRLNNSHPFFFLSLKSTSLGALKRVDRVLLAATARRLCCAERGGDGGWRFREGPIEPSRPLTLRPLCLGTHPAPHQPRLTLHCGLSSRNTRPSVCLSLRDSSLSERGWNNRDVAVGSPANSAVSAIRPVCMYMKKIGPDTSKVATQESAFYAAEIAIGLFFLHSKGIVYR